MKKYLLLFHDQWSPEPEVMNAWQAWFAKVGDRFIDSGTPLGPGLEMTRAGSRPLTLTDAAATGYSILAAANRDEAEAMLADCPFASSVRLYESIAM